MLVYLMRREVELIFAAAKFLNDPVAYVPVSIHQQNGLVALSFVLKRSKRQLNQTPSQIVWDLLCQSYLACNYTEDKKNTIYLMPLVRMDPSC